MTVRNKIRDKIWSFKGFSILLVVCLFAYIFMDVLEIQEISSKDIEIIEAEKIETEKIETEKKKVALTFDDGPNKVYTETLLEGLAERNVVATFFVIGKKAEENSEIIEKMNQQGHLIGNHTYSHIQLTAENEDIYKEEILYTNSLLEEIIGKETLFIRPPYGVWNEEYEEDLNMFPVLWTVDPLDWCTLNANTVFTRVINEVKENDIILLHDDYETSVTAALAIVDELQKQGYEFVTVDEILFN
ncbi:MAG: polysaccharide deacetylase family protein [Eubacteriales bacterium]